MHELIVAQEIVRIVESSIKVGRAGSVSCVNLAIGTLTGIQKECLEFAFSAVTKGTPLEGVELEVEYVKPLLQCRDCMKRFEPEDGSLSQCPDCGGFRCDLLKGDELMLTSIDLREGDENA